MTYPAAISAIIAAKAVYRAELAAVWGAGNDWLEYTPYGKGDAGTPLRAAYDALRSAHDARIALVAHPAAA
jgi:hypothetical protein